MQDLEEELDLASRIIERNVQREEEAKKRAELEKIRANPYDELGLMKPVEAAKFNPFAMANYITARILRRNPRLCRKDDTIFLGNRCITNSEADLCELALWPDTISLPRRVYIYKKLLELVPVLSPKKIIVADGLVWDMEKGELVEDPSCS